MADAGNDVDALDRDDMKRLSVGHDPALNNLMERHGAKLFNYLIRCLQNEEDAADAAQETFVRVYQHRMKFDPDQEFSTWLYTIATNLVKDRYRYRTRHPQVSLDSDNVETGSAFRQNFTEQRPTPDQHLDAKERAETVRRAIGPSAGRIAYATDSLRVRTILSRRNRRDSPLLGQGC